jgi:hypothetical protein
MLIIMAGLTKRAPRLRFATRGELPDAGDSGAIPSSFLRLVLSPTGRGHLPLKGKSQL